MPATRLNRLASASLAVGLAASVAACGGGRTDTATPAGGGNTGGTTGGTTASGAFTIDTSKCVGYEPTTGITDTEIKLGTSGPQSGAYGAAFGPIKRGYEAYFKYVNDSKGGVKGRKITLVSKDDEYKSDITRANIDEMVQKDKVFGFVNVIGTPNNLAVRTSLGEKCIPNLYVGTGAVQWGEAAQYPWLVGSLPSYATEGAVFADYLKKEKPTAKVAILQQNDDFGEGYTKAFEAAIKGSGITVSKIEKHEAGAGEVNAQITSLATDKPDALLVASAALACPAGVKAARGQQGWTPTIYVSATCNIKTLIDIGGLDNFKDTFTSAYLKDPADAAFDSDAAIKEFKDLGKKNGLSDEDISSGAVAYGWLVGQLTVEAFDKAGELTRKGVMESAYNMKEAKFGLLRDGISVSTNGSTDPFPIESLFVAKHDGTSFKAIGSLINFDGKTGQFLK